MRSGATTTTSTTTLRGSAEDEDAVDFSRGEAESTNGGMSPGQVIDVSSHNGDAYAGAVVDLLKLCILRAMFRSTGSV